MSIDTNPTAVPLPTATDPRADRPTAAVPSTTTGPDPRHPAGRSMPVVEEQFLVASEYRRRTAAVEIVVPVYDEEVVLDRSIRALHDYLADRFPLPWLITIVDNASTDGTWARAAALHADLPEVQAMRLGEKGRGRALRSAWSQSPAPVVAYMDVDLSTDLDALLPLVAPLLSGHSDVAIGTRLAAGSRVTRGPKREAISRTYNLILRTTLHSGFSDAQCGFKAVRSDVVRALLPLIEDQGWFFDTELLVLAEHNGLRIHEVPVDWVDDPDSRVDILRTATDDLRGVGRMLRRFARDQGWIERTVLVAHDGATPGLGGQLVRFASVGLVSTLLFGVLFAAFYGPAGAVPAAIGALAISSVANTAANRRLTFAQRGRHGRRRHWSGAAALSLLPLVLDLGALAVAAAAGITSTAGLLVALTLANALATAVRFVGLRRSMGR
ncbi:MAG TPA: glycosyltransferase [Acidimicrobiales bacterium]|nr:glycosyltransferase [Acidimicrobiales bacterium]